jgi:integrase
LVEQRTENPRVAGSIPALATPKLLSQRELRLSTVLSSRAFLLKSIADSVSSVSATMSRRVRFTPYFDKQTKKWSVSIPPQLSKTGKRARLFYDTREEALRDSRRLKERQQKFGVSLSSLDPVRMGEASEAYKRLDALGTSYSLISIVQGYIEQTRQKDRSRGILDVFNAYLEAKAHLDAVSKQQIGTVRDKFKTDISIAEITTDHLEQILSPLSGGTRNRYLRILKAVFNYALKKEWLQSNPVLRLDFVTLPKKTVEIFSNNDIKTMLTNATNNHLEMLPYIALGAFAGLRVASGELSRLLWEDIHFHDAQIVIRAEISKTHTRRFIPIPKCLDAWLTLMPESRKGLVLPIPPGTIRKLRRKIYPHRWIAAGLRHSYASACINSGMSIDSVCLALGHRQDPKMLWNHYFQATTKEQAESYWQIMPTF